MRKNSRTFVTLFYWLKFLGLNPLKISKSNELEFSYFGLVYGCLLTAINSFIFYGMIIERTKIVLPGDSPAGLIVDFIVIISCFLEATLTWLSFRFFQNRVKLIIESFSKAQKISVELGIPEDSERRLRHLGLCVLMVSCLYAAWMIFNNSTTKNYPDSHIVLWIFYSMIRLSSFNMLTIFLTSFVNVKQKFRQLNDKVRFVMRNVSDDEASQRSTRRSSRRTILISEIIETISQLHRQLRDVTDRIQEHCGGFVVCNVIAQLMALTIDVHIMYRFLKRRSGPITLPEILYACVICFWIFSPVLILTLISNICGSLSDEAKETGNILHATLNDRDNFGDSVAKFHLLSLELLKNPVKISLLGCLDVDQFFVYSTIGTGIRKPSLRKLRTASPCEEATTTDADRRQLDTHGQMMRTKTDRKERSRTLRMLYYWGKFVCIVQFKLSKNNEILFSYRGMFYGFALCASYTYMFYHLLTDRMKMLLPGETPISIIVNFIGITAGFLEIVLTWVIAGLHQNRVKIIVESFARAEKISRELRIPENYDKHFGELGLYLTIVHPLYVLWWAFNSWAVGQFSNGHVLVWMLYMVPRVNSYSTLILFIWSLAIVRRKFRRLNDRIRFVMRDGMTAGLLRRSGWNGMRHADKIDTISQLHRELRDAICRISGHFALVILLNIVSKFTNLVINVHVLYRVLKFSGPLGISIYPVLVVCWILIPVILLAVISNVCGSTVDEANETGNVLHSVINNCEHLLNLQAATVRCSNLQRFQLLSLDLLQNQVKISLFGFLDLNAFCMYSVIATATTHIMIMLQFYN